MGRKLILKVDGEVTIITPFQANNEVVVLVAVREHLITNLIYDDNIKIAIDDNNDGIVVKRGLRFSLKKCLDWD